MLSQTAKDLYWNVRHVPRWVVFVSKFTGDNPDELIVFDDYINSIERHYQEHHYKKLKEDLFDWCAGIVVENPELVPKPTTTPGEVTEDMITRAREFPITELIENKRMWALCPFHADRKPSLYLKKNFYYCFVCEAKGDTISLVQHIYNVDFKTAVKMLQ